MLFSVIWFSTENASMGFLGLITSHCTGGGDTLSSSFWICERGQAGRRDSSGLMACSTIPSQLASSPGIQGMMGSWLWILSHLFGVNPGIDTDLLGNFDTIWLQNEPEDVKGESIGEDIVEEPWHKYGLHPTVLLGLQVTVLGWDVLNGVLLLLMANLFCLLELTVWRSTNLPIEQY